MLVDPHPRSPTFNVAEACLKPCVGPVAGRNFASWPTRGSSTLKSGARRYDQHGRLHVSEFPGHAYFCSRASTCEINSFNCLMTIKICMPDVPSRDARVLTDGARVVGCGRTDGNGGGWPRACKDGPCPPKVVLELYPYFNYILTL